jgi:acyl-ACP thioesterase
MPEDLPAITAGTLTRGIRVGNADLDNNDHVNNVRYVEWALESLPPDFVRDRTVSRVEVHYKKELQAGGAAEIVSGTAEGDGPIFSHHSFFCGDTEICNLRLEWKT